MTEESRPVYILLHPDGRAEWGTNIEVAYKAMGNYGIGRAWLTDASLRLRVAMSDCALLPSFSDEFPLNPYAVTVLATVAGRDPAGAQETRGPVALFAFDAMNEWDSTRSFTEAEHDRILLALNVAGCTPV